MKFVDARNIPEQRDAFSERAFPAAPFPRKYIHAAFHDLQDAVLAFIALLGAGYDGGNIHLMTSRDFVEAVEQRQTLLGFLCSFNSDVCLHEANRGQHILSVRPATSEQMKQIRDLLIAYHVRSMTYVDTWTVTRLLP